MTGDADSPLILDQVDPRAAVVHEVVRIADDVDLTKYPVKVGDVVVHISAVNDIAAEFTESRTVDINGQPVVRNVKSLFVLVPANLVLAIAED